MTEEEREQITEETLYRWAFAANLQYRRVLRLLEEVGRLRAENERLVADYERLREEVQALRAAAGESDMPMAATAGAAAEEER